MNVSKNAAALAACIVGLAAAACAPADSGDSAGTEAAREPAPAATAVAPDTTGATVWAHLQQASYRDDWSLWPGKGRLYTGQEPHGMLLTTYLNEAARRALETGAATMPPGAVVVKENYMPDSTLAAVTVMLKAAVGYNPAANDWFFSKHLPDGSLDRTPEGMAMEGRVPGCTACHQARAANDFLFTGELATGGN